MRVTEAALARAPQANLRVSRAEFGAVWVAAEQRSAEQAERGVTDWYAAGIVVTCRWLAAAVVTSSNGRRRLAWSPATERTVVAYEELIEAEYLAAERLDMRQPRPAWLLAQPGWSEAICATLRWAWRHDGPSPLAVPAHATG